MEITFMTTDSKTKRYEEIRKLRKQGGDYTTAFLLDYEYIKTNID